MRRIRVLILVDKFDYHGSFINGPTRYFSWLVKTIDPVMFDVRICVLLGKGKSDNVFQQENIQVTYLNASKFNPLVLLTLVRLIRREKIDLLHLTGYGSTLYGRLAGAICGRPTIVHEHWVDPEFGGLQGAVERLMNVFTTRAIAISAYSRDFLVHKKGISPDRIVMIPNGVPLGRFRGVDQQTGRLWRRTLNIPNETKVIGIIGMLHVNKGHAYFIKAAAQVAACHPETRFVIVGDGEQRENLETLVAQLGLRKFVLFLGQQEDIPGILKMLDIFVIASISETAPLSLLEAMSAGKAIITTDCGGPAEVIEDNRTGLIAPVRDPDALAWKIERLIDQPELAAFLGRNAELESVNFDLKLNVQKVQQLYLDIVSPE